MGVNKSLTCVTYGTSGSRGKAFWQCYIEMTVGRGARFEIDQSEESNENMAAGLWRALGTHMFVTMLIRSGGSQREGFSRNLLSLEDGIGRIDGKEQKSF